MKFNELIKNKNILKALEKNNFVAPTDIQSKIMPLIIDGKDVLGQSQTGTGKTLAFAAPILERIEENKKVQTLILAPTRELALQISNDISNYSQFLNIHITCVYGSSSIDEQIKYLNRGSEIVIGTPGRVMDLIKRNKLKLSEIRFFVLDEADEMMSMGFQEELEFIFKSIHNDKQVMLFSATMPKKIRDIAENYMSSEYETITIESKTKTADNIEQFYYLTQNNRRYDVLLRLLDYYNFHRIMIFVRTKRNADELLEKLLSNKYDANLIHGDVPQAQRIKTLDLFKSGAFKILIATDVAARGIHVDDIDLVINYNLPESNEAYVHRIGRTGRANKSGMSATIVTDKEEHVIKELEHYTNSVINIRTVPNREEILSNRVSNIVKDINCLKDKDNHNDIINSTLIDLSNEELKNITMNLLEERLMDGIGSNFNINLNEVSSKKKRKDSSDGVRVFLTIGKLDGINKREFLSFIERKCGFKEGTCYNLEILSKFTFMHVKNNSFDKLMKVCNGIKYNDRLIKVEKAKK